MRRVPSLQYIVLRLRRGEGTSRGPTAHRIDQLVDYSGIDRIDTYCITNKSNPPIDKSGQLGHDIDRPLQSPVDILKAYELM